MLDISFLTIGSELLDGRILDSNSQTMSKKLWNVRLKPNYVITCGDSVKDIVSSLTFLSKSTYAEYKVIVITGGLGPTADDLTRDAIASFFNVELCFREEIAARLKELYKKRGRTLGDIPIPNQKVIKSDGYTKFSRSETPGGTTTRSMSKATLCDSSIYDGYTNLRQAYMPEESQIIPNNLGTAPGIYQKSRLGDGSEISVFALPGVPKEMNLMFDEFVVPKIKNYLPKVDDLEKVTLTFFGLPESEIGVAVEGCVFDSSTEIAYQVKFPEIRVQVTAKDVEVESRKVIKAIGKDHFVGKGNRIPDLVIDFIKDNNLSINILDGATLGNISQTLISSVRDNYPNNETYKKIVNKLTSLNFPRETEQNISKWYNSISSIFPIKIDSEDDTLKIINRLVSELFSEDKGSDSLDLICLPLNVEDFKLFSSYSSVYSTSEGSDKGGIRRQTRLLSDEFELKDEAFRDLILVGYRLKNENCLFFLVSLCKVGTGNSSLEPIFISWNILDVLRGELCGSSSAKDDFSDDLRNTGKYRYRRVVPLKLT